MKSIKGMRLMIEESYERYSKKNEPYIMPHFGDNLFVVLPPAKMHELFQKSDAEVDAHVLLNEQVQTTYTVGDDISIDNFHFDIVRRRLTRSLPLLTESIYEELALAIKDQWKVVQDEWTPIKVLPTCTKIVARTESRVFTGVELCRNNEFVEHAWLYARGVVWAAAIIKLFPVWLRPIIGPIIVFPNRKNLAIYQKYAVPVIRDRLEMIANKAAQPDSDLQAPVRFFDCYLVE
ncbi:MAG: hypothetical protein Q9157_002463 [Trypethelium eluteriae]